MHLEPKHSWRPFFWGGSGGVIFLSALLPCFQREYILIYSSVLSGHVLLWTCLEPVDFRSVLMARTHPKTKVPCVAEDTSPWPVPLDAGPGVKI